MGKIFYVMGKSAAGKDTAFKGLLERIPELKTVVPYTTRPIRNGESEGAEYHFITEEALDELKRQGKLIERRTYQTVLGPWSYGTVNDEQINLANHDYLMIGTLESYENTKKYFGEDYLFPLYLQLEDGERLERALIRERKQKKPKFEELCRRFLADQKDFSEEKLRQAGVEERYSSHNMGECLDLLEKVIREEINRQILSTRQ